MTDVAPTDTDVTLGEVNRNVSGLRGDVRELTKDVTALKVESGTIKDRMSRMEKTVYGAIGAAIASIVTSGVTILLNR